MSFITHSLLTLLVFPQRCPQMTASFISIISIGTAVRNLVYYYICGA